MTSKKNYKELENEKVRGKRRFLERRVQENEAEQEINDYDYSDNREQERDVGVREY